MSAMQLGFPVWQKKSRTGRDRVESKAARQGLAVKRPYSEPSTSTGEVNAEKGTAVAVSFHQPFSSIALIAGSSNTGRFTL
jgi:hypothetical protein